MKNIIIMTITLLLILSCVKKGEAVGEIPKQTLITIDRLDYMENLPDSTIQKLDEIILSNSSGKYKKVAMVIAGSLEGVKEIDSQIDEVHLLLRIKSLIENKKLRFRGDISYMRHSEIRKKRGH